MTQSCAVSRLEQAAYDAVRSTLPTAQLRVVLTTYFVSWRLRREQHWGRLARRGFFEVISPAEKIFADRAAGAVVIILSRAGESEDDILHRCKRSKKEGAAYIFVVLNRLLRVDVLQSYMEHCDGVFFTSSCLGGANSRLPTGCYEIRTGPVHPDVVLRKKGDSP